MLDPLAPTPTLQPLAGLSSRFTRPHRVPAFLGHRGTAGCSVKVLDLPQSLLSFHFNWTHFGSRAKKD